MLLPFRLLNFFLKIIASFIFVFILQIQWDGKTLESYLNDFGKKFFLTRGLKNVSQDGAKVLKGISSSKEKKHQNPERKLSNSSPLQYTKNFVEKITLPTEGPKDQ